MERAGFKVILYRRYVDDINTLIRKLLTQGEAAPSIPDDAAIMQEVKQIAETIHRSIQVTVDCPAYHDDKKVPILDLKVWLQTVTGGVDGSTVLLLHEYYYKDVATKAVVDVRSAVPVETKRITLIQEVLRILRNCSRRLPWSTVRDHIQTFCARMQFSGHDLRMRTRVVEAAVAAYKKQVQRDKAGEVPLYRPRGWNVEERVRKKRRKKSEWFRGKRQHESVIFVPATPGSVLKRRYLQVIWNSGINLAVVEVPGHSLKKRIQRSDPFKPDVCSRADVCLVCGGAVGDRKGGGNCRAEGVTYKIECVACGCVYVGETARNAHTRGLEHSSSVSRKELRSPLYLRCAEQHQGTPVDFQMRVTGTFGGDALKRQISESVQIQRTETDLLMNRRDEWRQTILPRTSLC